jgi:hypothetical protein
MRSVCFLALLLCICAAMPSLAQEVLIDCQLDNKALSSKEMAKSKEQEAMAWYNDPSFRRRKFVLDVGASKILDGPGSPDVWRQPQITITSQDIEVEWQFHASPLDRSPRVWLKVNRFTGVAAEGYSMLKGPNQGSRMVYWGRPGTCSITKRLV